MRKFHDDTHRGPQHTVCAISGLATDDGSRLHITHIIPAEHFAVYPISGVQEGGGVVLDDYNDGDKWDMTWDREFNGIALLDHFRSLWVARFWAIDPVTMTIAVMAPCTRRCLLSHICLYFQSAYIILTLTFSLLIRRHSDPLPRQEGPLPHR